MKHFSTPAWSMGTKTQAQPITTDKLSPAPDTYTVRKQEIEVPCNIIGTGSRPPLYQLDQNPAPTAYTLPTFVDPFIKPEQKRRQKGFKGAPRDKTDKTKMDTPGPGSYNPKKSLQMPSHSLGNKAYSLMSPPINQVGPGQYEPNHTSIQTKTQYKIGTGKRSNLHSQRRVPGPGTYETIPQKDGPHYKFGTDQRTRRRTVENPAPWDYNIPGMAEELKNKMGKTILPKRPPLANSLEVPGPGAYPVHQPKFTKIKAGMSVGNGHRSNFTGGKEGPGPGNYQPKNVTHVARSSSFGTGKRPPINNTNSTPGPGAYEFQPAFETGPKYWMNGRQPGLKDLMNNPGPGQYMPDVNASKPLGSSHVIGTGLRSNVARSRPKTMPGPGHYFSFRNSEGPFWTFTRDPRSKYDYQDEPGPGQYEIPASVPDVPKYLLGSATGNQSFK